MANFTPRPVFHLNNIEKSSGKIIGLLSFLIAVISLLGVVYLWLMSGAPMTVPSANMLTQALKGNTQEESEPQVKLAEFAATQQSLAETQNSLAAIEEAQKLQETSLNNLQATNSGTLKLAEVEYLLTLANHRVMLINDIDGGIGLLEAADKSMVGQNITNSLKIRQAIAKDIAVLKALPKVDVEGIYSQLSALTMQTAQLPQFEIPEHKKNQESTESVVIAQEREEAELIDQLTKPEYESAESFAEKVQASTSRSTKSLWERIGVNYHSDFKAQPILSPEQHFVFTQNVRLLIEEAKVALLTGEQTVFENSLKEAESLLSIHAQKVAQATSMRDTLALLQEEQVQQASPSELTSLRTLLGNKPNNKNAIKKEAVQQTEKNTETPNETPASDAVETQGATL